MTATEYSAIKKREALTHEALATLLGIEPNTSRIYAMRGLKNRTVINLLRIIEAIGVAEARRIINGESKCK